MSYLKKILIKILKMRVWEKIRYVTEWFNPAMVAERSKDLSQIQVVRMPWVPGLNSARDYDIHWAALK